MGEPFRTGKGVGEGGDPNHSTAQNFGTLYTKLTLRTVGTGHLSPGYIGVTTIYFGLPQGAVRQL